MGSRATTAVARLAAVVAVGYALIGYAAHFMTAEAARDPLLSSPEPVIGPVMAIIGGVLLGRVPGHRVLLLLTGMGCSACVFAGSYFLSQYGFATDPDPAPFFRFAAWLALWAWATAFVPLATLLPLIFPDGRLPSPRWRPAAVGGVALTVAFVLVGAFTTIGAAPDLPPNPVAVDALTPYVPVLEVVISAALPVLALVAISSLVVRFRRSGPLVRRQIAWVGYALAWTITASILFPTPVFALTTLSVPVAVGIAVVRYRLFGIDVVANRTLVGAALLSCSALVYVAVVGWLGGLAGAPDSVIGFAGAVAVAAVFHPLYVRIQRAVDRLLHGHRGDPYRVLGNVTDVLRRAGSPRQALAQAVETIAEDLKLPAVTVQVERPDAPPVVESVGDPTSAVHEFPLHWHDDVVGTLHVAHRTGTDGLDRVDCVLLADLAAQLAGVGFALRLVTDLERSRDRLVSAREEERLRIRRDLHDGLGPQLASAVMALDVAARALGDGTGRAAPLVGTARDQLQEAVADVRRIVHGLRPPALDELGLLGALRATGPALLGDGHATPRITVHGHGCLDRLPPAVEVAAFRITQEAVTNAVRHATATAVSVSLDGGRDDVRVEIRDDGRGLSESAAGGLGLQSMRDRAAELGGTCTVVSPSAGGTCVTAVLPLDPGGS